MFAVCLVIRRLIFLWSSSSSQLSYYLVRLRATVVLAAGAHVRVARAPVVDDGSADVFLDCTSTTMWCLPAVSWLKLSSTQRSIHPGQSSDALAACLPRSSCFCLRFFRFVPANGSVSLGLCSRLVLLDESASQRVMLLPGCFFFFESGTTSSGPASSSSSAILIDVDLLAFPFVLRAGAQASFGRRLCCHRESVHKWG